MKPNTCLVIDTWEGQLEIDEAVLKSNGVAGIAIRLNDMNGGHHMDTNFVKQWNEARNFVRFPYFVYNPWVNGATNFNWLRDHLPVGVKTVAADIEVKYPGYPTNTYASEVAKFLKFCGLEGLKVIIYTGQWFLEYMSSWPKSYDYWWAQYPDPIRYFGTVKTWNDLKTTLDSPSLEKPFNLSAVPGTLKMWQFSGDYLLLPGNARDMDVNLFYGSEIELAEYFGVSIVPEPDPKPEPTDEVKIQSVKTGDQLVPELLTVRYKFGDLVYEQTVDQRPVFPPTNDLYRVASERWPLTHAPLTIPPGGGPLTQTLSHSPKKAYAETPLNSQWQAYIKRFNSDIGWKKIAAIDYGPSKGINSNGMLRYIGLVWPSNASTNNVVKVLEISGEWARIDSIAIDGSEDLTKISPTLTPWLFHKVCDNKGNPVTQNIICPILGGSWWVPLQALIKL